MATKRIAYPDEEDSRSTLNATDDTSSTVSGHSLPVGHYTAPAQTLIGIISHS